jgi:hypothetical protein
MFMFFFSLVDPEFSLSHFTTSIMPKEVIFQAGHTRRGKPTIVQKIVKPSKVISTKRGRSSCSKWLQGPKPFPWKKEMIS